MCWQVSVREELVAAKEQEMQGWKERCQGDIKRKLKVTRPCEQHNS